MITDEQRAERINYIGSSDAPAVLGISRWKTPLQVWSEKTGNVVPEDISDHLPAKLGNRLEQVVAELFMEKTGYKVRRVNETFYHPRYNFLACNIDRRVVGSEAILECKICSPFKAKEWAGDDIPAEYVCQVMQQLSVTGYKEAYLAVLIGNTDFKVKLVQRHDGVINDMERKLAHFWQTYIVPKVMPMIITSQDADTLYSLFPMEADPELAFTDELRDEIEKLADMRGAFYADMKSLEAQIEKLENEIKARLGKAASAKTGRHLITWKAQKQTRLDTKLLTAEMPEIYAKYAREISTRVLRIKQLKE